MTRTGFARNGIMPKNEQQLRGALEAAFNIGQLNDRLGNSRMFHDAGQYVDELWDACEAQL